MVRIGLLGVGFMGRIHSLALKGVRGATLAAVCSRDSAKLRGDWSGTRGNFGPEPGFFDLTGVKTFSDYDAMLADPDIDLIDICTPTDLHPEAAIAALKAGKHVLVEKAIALTTAEADAMMAAAVAAGKMLMVAHVLPFFPEFADAVKTGRYGKLVAATLTRVISKPDWSADIGDAAKTGGPAVDLHIHDTHFVGLLCGTPKEVSSVGTVEKDAVTYVATNYVYDKGGPAVSCTSGAVAAAGRPFAHGFELYLEKATLAYHSGGVPLTLFTADGKSETPTLEGGGDPLAAFVAELQAAVDGVTSGTTPEGLSGRIARDALEVCLSECESVKLGRPVRVS
jgi:predicted dehydrogenase